MSNKVPPVLALSAIAAMLLGASRDDEMVAGIGEHNIRRVPLAPMPPRVPDPELGWFKCACGAKADPYDRKWRNLGPKALMLAMGWEKRGSEMVCPKCRALCGDDSVTGGWADIGGVRQKCAKPKKHEGDHASEAGVCWARIEK